MTACHEHELHVTLYILLPSVGQHADRPDLAGQHAAGPDSGDEDYDVHKVEMLKYTPRGTLPHRGDQTVQDHRLPGANHFSENPIYGMSPDRENDNDDDRFYFNMQS